MMKAITLFQKALAADSKSFSEHIRMLAECAINCGVYAFHDIMRDALGTHATILWVKADHDEEMEKHFEQFEFSYEEIEQHVLLALLDMNAEGLIDCHSQDGVDTWIPKDSRQDQLTLFTVKRATLLVEKHIEKVGTSQAFLDVVMASVPLTKPWPLDIPKQPVNLSDVGALAYTPGKLPPVASWPFPESAKK